MTTLKVKKKVDRQHPGADTVKAELEKEPLVRLNLNVPESLRRDIKSRAAQEGRTVQDVVIGLIRGYLSEKEQMN